MGGNMTEKPKLTQPKTEPLLTRARYPKDVPCGALVFAPYRDDLFPAIKWEVRVEGDTHHGLAYLQPIIEEYQHPLSLHLTDGEWVLIVQSEWHFRMPLDRARITANEPSDRGRSGFVFGNEKTYLRVDLMNQDSRILSRQLIDLASGESPQRVIDTGLTYLDGWDLILGDGDKPFLSWRAAPPA